MRQNPYNAIICLGHARGTVTMWAPNEPIPAVKMLCHSGPVTAMAIDNAGTYICCVYCFCTNISSYMATAGVEGMIKVWDMRTYQPLHLYHSKPFAQSLSISQRGVLAVGAGAHVTVAVLYYCCFNNIDLE